MGVANFMGHPVGEGAGVEHSALAVSPEDRLHPASSPHHQPPLLHSHHSTQPPPQLPLHTGLRLRFCRKMLKNALSHIAVSTGCPTILDTPFIIGHPLICPSVFYWTPPNFSTGWFFYLAT